MQHYDFCHLPTLAAFLINFIGNVEKSYKTQHGRNWD